MVRWQSVLVDTLQGRVGLTVPDLKQFPFIPCGLVPVKEFYSVFKNVPLG